MKTLNYFTIILLLSLIIGACNKDATSTSNSITVGLSSNFAPYNAVNLDIKSIEVTENDGSKAILNTKAGIYNLLETPDGKDLIIADGQVDFKQIEQIKIIVGSNNTVVKDNVSYPLILPDSIGPVLNIPIHKTLIPGNSNFVLLDIDLKASITSHSPGNFILRPVFRAIDASLTGTVRGQVVPGNIVGSVRAVTKGHIIYSSISATGNFKIRGLQPGKYSVTVLPDALFLPKTVSEVNVVADQTVDVGVMHLQVVICDFCKITERF